MAGALFSIELEALAAQRRSMLVNLFPFVIMPETEGDTPGYVLKAR